MYIFLILISFVNKVGLNGGIVYIPYESTRGISFGVSSRTQKFVGYFYGSFSLNYLGAKWEMSTRRLSWRKIFLEAALMYDDPKSIWYIGGGINLYRLWMSDEHIPICVDNFDESGIALVLPIIGIEFSIKRISIDAGLGFNNGLLVYGAEEASKYIFPMHYVKIGVGYEL